MKGERRAENPVAVTIENDFYEMLPTRQLEEGHRERNYCYEMVFQEINSLYSEAWAEHCAGQEPINYVNRQIEQLA